MVSRGPSVKVVIPVLNEESSIGNVLRDLPVDGIDEVVVVDNGSTDGSGQEARASGATVLEERRRGYGWACQAGIDYLARNPPDVVAFIDGDYSDHPEELADVVRPVLDGRADLVIGSRMLGRAEPGALLPQARVGNWLAGVLIEFASGVRFTDLGPMRAIRFADLQSLQMEEMTYGWTVEMQIKAVKAGLRCTEIPVSYRKRIGASKVTGTVAGTVKASARILYLLGKYVIRR